MFEIKGLKVKIEDKEIIKGLDLTIKNGEIHAIMGPNGAGKSSLSEALMGHPSFEVQGSIKLDGEELIDLSADERFKKGLFLAFQSPEEVEGVKVSNFIRKAALNQQSANSEDSNQKNNKIKSKKSVTEPKHQVSDMDKLLEIHTHLVKNTKKLGLEENFVNRELNLGFSGGEKKRLEILQLITFKPKMVILDEVDSGLDVDGIKLISKAINDLKDGKRSFLLITHYPRILKYIKPDYVHILQNGKIVKTGTEKLAHQIEESGYEETLKK